MLARFADPALFVAAFSAVAAKQREARREEPLIAAGPSAAAVGHEVDGLARRLANLVSTGRYVLSAMEPRRALIEGKWRTLYHSPPLDTIVLTAVGQVLSRLLEPTFSPQLYSYRQGFSTSQALFALASYMKRHRSERPDVRSRGLYVVRRDVKAYGDAIPSGADAVLWPRLRAALEGQGGPMAEADWQWLVQAIKPQVSELAGFALSVDRGIPTGSPLQPLICNFYLAPVDRAFDAVDQGFYARFGDDMLFVHPDAATAHDALESIDSSLAELGLALSADKCSALYVTAAGRAASAAPAFRGTSSFKYLGLRVHASGEVGLSTDKATRLLRAVRTRVARVSSVCGEQVDFAERAKLLCDVVNAALEPSHPAADQAAPLLRQLVSDRAQLKDLDFQIALRLAEQLTGVRGVRAFRRVSMRALKREFGLRSLVLERNQVERTRRSVL